MLSRAEIAKSVVRKWSRATETRGNWESHWEEIAKRILPSYAGSFQSDLSTRTQGEKRTEEMVDATGAAALPRFASVMESMLTPRNSKWHRLVAGDKVLKRNKQVRDYLEDVRDVMFKRRYSARANYASQQFETYMSLGAFGTGAMFIDGNKRDGGLRYRASHLAEVYFLEDFEGRVDTALRRFPLTARQAVQMFDKPDDTLHEKILEAAMDDKKADEKFWFIHCIKPRDEIEGYDKERRDARGMRYASYYVCERDAMLVRDAGYRTFPWAISRYVTAPGETYGRSPAMMVLPSLKLLNEQKRTIIKQGHRIVDPVLLAHDDGVLDTFSLRPGAINMGGMSAEGRRLVDVLPTGQLAEAKELMQDERSVVNDAFLITLFQILVETPTMTATEVLERTREKGMLLGPTMGRQQSEALGPQIERELDILAEQGVLPRMPEMLAQAEAEYEIEYDSPMSRAMRAEEGAGLFRTVDWVREYVNITQDRAPLDWIDWDEAMPEILDIQAVPSRWIRGPEAVAEMRATRDQQAQMQQLTEAAPALAGTAKALASMPGAAAPA